jgi:hypothetical protein
LDSTRHGRPDAAEQFGHGNGARNSLSVSILIKYKARTLPSRERRMSMLWMGWEHL